MFLPLKIVILLILYEKTKVLSFVISYNKIISQKVNLFVWILDNYHNYHCMGLIFSNRENF